MNRYVSLARSRTLVLLAAALALSAGCRKPTDAERFDFTAVQSTFDADGEGWTVLGDAESLVWRPTDGNPNGYIAARDRVEGDNWFWVAPAKFHGNMRGAYGSWLMFDLRQDRITQNFAPDDVVLVGGGITLTYDLPNDPSTAWTAYRVALEEAGWVEAAARTPATREQMQTVLTSLTELRIRGEFFRGTDEGDLDNVTFGAPR